MEQVIGEGEDIIAMVKRSEEAERKCPHCQSSSLYSHGQSKGKGPRRVRHSWINGRTIYLEFSRQRWRCRSCGHTFAEGRDLVRQYARMTKAAELEALWWLKDRNFSQVTKELGISYKTLRSLMDREIDGELAAAVLAADNLFLGIDEHSFKHQELVFTITELRQKKVLGILKDDRIATLKVFLKKIPKEKVREVCIDMKESLRKASESFFPEARVVADHFHVIADANKRVDEARRIEQDVRRRRKVVIPKKIFLLPQEKLDDAKREKLEKLLIQYPSLKGFYWAKEKLREVYRVENGQEATKLLDSIIFSLKSDDDGELIRWSNTLKHWREPILNYFEHRTTNGFTEGCHTKIKMLKRISYGLRNAEVYWKKMLLGFVPCRTCFHNF